MITVSTPSKKVYDSGWFDVAASTAYVKSHALGTADISISLFYKDTANSLGLGVNRVYKMSAIFSDAGIQHSCFINNITTSQLTVQAGGRVFSCCASGAHKFVTTGGQYRVIATEAL